VAYETISAMNNSSNLYSRPIKDVRRDFSEEPMSEGFIKLTIRELRREYHTISWTAGSTIQGKPGYFRLSVSGIPRVV
jgi:hypothetical protein